MLYIVFTLIKLFSDPLCSLCGIIAIQLLCLFFKFFLWYVICLCLAANSSEISQDGTELNLKVFDAWIVWRSYMCREAQRFLDTADWADVNKVQQRLMKAEQVCSEAESFKAYSPQCLVFEEIWSPHGTSPKTRWSSQRAKLTNCTFRWSSSFSKVKLFQG